MILLTAFYALSVLYLLRGLFNGSANDNRKHHFFSVIITVHNEEKKLPQCLHSIASQNYPSGMYEVIIADDRSDDNTPGIIDSFCSKHTSFKSVSVRKNEKFIPKKTALIKALNISKGDIIISTDGDCMVTTNWLSSINSYFTDDIGMVIGHTNYKRPHNLLSGIDALDYLSHRALGIAFAGVGSAYTCTASNFAYRREIFENVKKEFSTLKVRPAEDNYLLHAVHKRPDYKITFATDPDSIVTTEGASNFSHFLNQRFRWSAYGGNIVTSGVKLFFIPALLYYSAIWIAIIIVFIKSSLLPILAVSLFLKLAVDFLFVFKSCEIFYCRYLLKYFLFEWLLHLILTPLIVIKGNLFSFRWKDKRYNRSREIDKK